MKKRFLAMFLALCLTLALLPTAALAANAKEGDTTVADSDGYYKLSNPISKVGSVPKDIVDFIRQRGSDTAEINGLYVVPVGTVITNSDPEGGVSYLASDGIGDDFSVEVAAGKYMIVWGKEFHVFYGEDSEPTQPNPGETTIKTDTGIEFTLSKAVLGTKTTTFGAETGDPYPTQVYVIPEGTVVTPKLTGTLPAETGRALAVKMGYSGEIESDDTFKMNYELFDMSGQGVNIVIGETGIEFTPEKLTGDVPYSKDGVYMIECRLWVGMGWTRVFAGFELVADEASTDPQPTQPAEDVAHASAQTVTVDGKPVEFQMYALKDANGNDTNYIKLRDMAYVLNGTKAQFSVGYDQQSGTITAATGAAYEEDGTEMKATFGGADKEYVKTTLTIQLDGKPVQLEAITLTDDAGGGYNYCMVRDLGRTFNFNVDWNADVGIYIESDKPYSGQ